MGFAGRAERSEVGRERRLRSEPWVWASPAAPSEARSVVSYAIVAELVGNVLTVVTPEGTAVSSGDTIVIIESMKMEIPVLTEIDGVVRDVAVRAGDIVQEGDVLAVVD
jgi:biotin carboxyl carrier protein